jgi:hypothetical protein
MRANPAAWARLTFTRNFTHRDGPVHALRVGDRLVVWLGSSHTYWADTLALPESMCKVSTGSDDCSSSAASVSLAAGETLASRQ